MSEDYIRNHFEDIRRYAGVVENRVDDEYCTMEATLKDNACVLEECLKYGVNYILIEEEYLVDLEL